MTELGQNMFYKQLISVISHLPGSLPPSPADSGVSDVDPSSSSQTSDEESKIHSRLQIHGKKLRLY